MSDYSNLKIEKTDEFPLAAPRGTGAAKPLSPNKVYETLPFLKELEVGDVVKFELPEDRFGYNVDTTVTKDMAKYDSTMRNAITRSFELIAEREKKFFVFRIVDGVMYIKRVQE